MEIGIKHGNRQTYRRFIWYAQANCSSQHVQSTRTVRGSGQQQMMPERGKAQCMTESKTDNPVSAHFLCLETGSSNQSVHFSSALATCRSSFLSMLGKVNMLSAHASFYSKYQVVLITHYVRATPQKKKICVIFHSLLLSPLCPNFPEMLKKWMER